MLGFVTLQPRTIKVRRMVDGAYVDGIYVATNMEQTTHIAVINVVSDYEVKERFGDVENFSEVIAITLNDGFMLRVAREINVADVVSLALSDPFNQNYKVVGVDARPNWGYCRGYAERLPEDAGFFERSPKS